MGKSKTLKPQESALLQRHVAIDGDGNVVGNDNTVQVTNLAAGDYAVQIGEQRITFNVAELRSVLNVENSQVGVIGDHAHIDKVIFQTTAPTNPRERRNRAAMLQLVHNTWIKGVLEQSLHGAAMLELGKDYDPQAVERPWDLEYHLPGQEPRPVPEGTSILEIFDQCSGALLILGEPGSGKTTTLLELARALIVCAEVNPTALIPVVFNLSSWGTEQHTFDRRLLKKLRAWITKAFNIQFLKKFRPWITSPDSLDMWIREELRTKYNIPEKIARSWLEKDALLPLFDGLDEVKGTARKHCVDAINDFRKTHLVPMAVCSRTADYDALTVKLQLQGSIHLKPLSLEKVNAYVAGAGTELQAVRAMLRHDSVLQDLAQYPLMLSIMTLAYRGIGRAELESLATLESRRQHLFDTYIMRMFQRRTKDQPYSPRQTCQWLTWLARQMGKFKQSVFLIDDLQPESDIGVALVVSIVWTLVSILFIGLFPSLVNLLIGFRVMQQIAMVVGFIGGLIWSTFYSVILRVVSLAKIIRIAPNRDRLIAVAQK